MKRINKDIFTLTIVFVLAFLIRFIAWTILEPLFNGICADSIEYYFTSINLEPHKFFKLLWGYDHWYQRTPAYVLFLHVIGRSLIVQIILSSFGCVIMYKINKYAGLLWIFYPQDIIHSFQYNKECLMVFLVIIAIFCFKNRKILLVGTYISITLLFVSYAWITNGQHSAGSGIMKNFWTLWQPSFNTSIGYSKIFVYLQFIPYILFMLYFIRNVRFTSAIFYIFAILSITYGVIYAEPRFREPFMPLLFLFCAPAFEHLASRIKRLLTSIDIQFKLYEIEKKLINQLERRIKDEKLMSELY